MASTDEIQHTHTTMSTALLETSEASATQHSWRPTIDREQMREGLRSGADRARSVAHAVVVSITWPIPHRDLVDIFAAAGEAADTVRFFWEQPARSAAFLGLGVAASLSTSSDAPIVHIAQQWRSLLADAVTIEQPELPVCLRKGPVCFGGGAFDPRAQRTALWRGFPDALLVLPALTFAARGEEAALTANIVVADDATQATLDGYIGALEDQLHSLEAALDHARENPSARRGSVHLTASDILPAVEWRALVRTVKQSIHAGQLQKVVLARGVDVEAESALDVEGALRMLRETYPAATTFACQIGERCFLGATPELLARVSDGPVQTMALAGSASRGTTPADDKALGDELLRSTKNLREHAVVVETIAAELASLVSHLDIPTAPLLMRLANVQHLHTPITGELAEGKTLLDVVGALHPTPAVGGFPRDAALSMIREDERLDRGWYAGPLGWIDADGEGEFVVALRSALVTGERATLFAGCGIVADSDPDREYEESCLKLRVMLDALRGKN